VTLLHDDLVIIWKSYTDKINLYK